MRKNHASLSPVQDMFRLSVRLDLDGNSARRSHFVESRTVEPCVVEPRVTLNNADLRNHCLSLIRRSNINFSTQFLKPTQSELEKRPEIECWDGVMNRPEGYFRVAVEKETGIKIILFEFEPQHLTGEQDEEGSVVLSHRDMASSLESPDVYVVDAFHPDTDQPILADAVENFCTELRTEIIPDLDLYLRDETPHKSRENNNTLADSTEYRFTNSHLAFGLFLDEKNSDHWHVKLHSSLRGDTEDSGEFEQIKRPSGHKINKFTQFFLMQEDVGEAQSFINAYDRVMRFWGLSALKKFKGGQILSENMTMKMVWKKKGFKNKMYFASRYLRQQTRKGLGNAIGFARKNWRTYGISGVISGILSLSLFKTRLLVAVGAMVGVFFSTLFGKFIDETAQRGMNHVFRDRAEYNEMKAILPQRRSYKRLVTEKGGTSEKRVLKKLDPVFLDRIELLDHLSSGVMNSMDKTVGVNRPNWKSQYLSGSEMRIFGKANVALCDDTVLKIMPNGVVSLTKIHKEFNKVSKYYTYLPELVTSKSAPLHPQIKKMLEKSIFRVVDDKRVPRLEEKIIRRSDFRKEMNKIYAEDVTPEGEATHLPSLLSRLFGAQSGEDPRACIANLLTESAQVAFEAPADPLDRLIRITKHPKAKAPVKRFFRRSKLK